MNDKFFCFIELSKIIVGSGSVILFYFFNFHLPEASFKEFSIQSQGIERYLKHSEVP